MMHSTSIAESRDLHMLEISGLVAAARCSITGPLTFRSLGHSHLAACVALWFGAAAAFAQSTQIVGSVSWDGNALANVEVDLKGPLSQGNFYTLPTLSSAITGADGTFVIQNPPIGQYMLYPVSPSNGGYWAFSAYPVMTSAGQVTNVGVLRLYKVVQLLSPGNNSTISTTNPTLQWAAFPGATSYLVEVFNPPTVVFSQSTTGTEATVSPALSTGGAYDWAVYAYDSTGEIAYYEFEYFTVAGPSASQTIMFSELGNVPLGAAPFTISATASSGLPVSFASTTSAVCTVSGNTVTIVAAGTCSITASQGGNAKYAAATQVTQSFIVGSVGASTYTYTGNPFTEASGVYQPVPKPGVFGQPRNASGVDLNGGKIEACDKELAAGL